MTDPDTSSSPQDTDIPRPSRSSKHTRGQREERNKRDRTAKGRTQETNRLPPLPETREKGRPCLGLRGAPTFVWSKLCEGGKGKSCFLPRAPVPLQPCQVSAVSIWALNLAHPPLRGWRACGGRGATQAGALRIQRCLFPGALLGCGPNPSGEPGEVAPAGGAV